MATRSSIVTMNVSLPQPLKQYVDSKVSGGIYSSASEFIREAIREKLSREQEVKDARAELESKLLQGLDSGKPIPYRKGFFNGEKKSLIRKNKTKSNRS